jgi:hypothetical protein
MVRILFIAPTLAPTLAFGLALGVSLASSAYCQSGRQPVLWDTYVGLSAQGGVQSFQARPSNLEVFYTDESGFDNTLQVFRYIEDEARANTIAIYYEGGTVGGMHYEAGASFLLGNPWHAMLSLGSGFNFQVGRLIVRPKVQAGITLVTTSIGTVANPDQSGFRVDGDQFWEQDIQVNIGLNYLFTNPVVDILYPISRTVALKTYLGYVIPIAVSEARLRFTGKDPSIDPEYDSGTTATERLSDANVELYDNGNRVTALPYRYKGIMAGIGLSINIMQ